MATPAVRSSSRSSDRSSPSGRAAMAKARCLARPWGRPSEAREGVTRPWRSRCMLPLSLESVCMPVATLNRTAYAYVDEGSGPLIVFGHGLLAGREMFRAQIDALKDRYRCVSVDWPGHGDTGFAPGGWTMWDMARDAAALVEHLGAPDAVFAGLSQGGMAFMRLALERPELVRALVLMDTSADPEDESARPHYEQLTEGMRHGDEATRSALMDTV